MSNDVQINRRTFIRLAGLTATALGASGVATVIAGPLRLGSAAQRPARVGQTSKRQLEMPTDDN